MANYLSLEKKKRIFMLLCEGSGTRQISRIVGVTSRTVQEHLKRYYLIAEYIQRKYIRGLTCTEIEADEIRTFVNTIDNLRWVYIGIDRKSRLVINFHIGKRDTNDAKKFLEGLRWKLNCDANVYTDCLASYVAAVAENKWGYVDSGVRPLRIVRKFETGEKNNRHMTNHIETLNGNVRQSVAKLTRKTRRFAKTDSGLLMHLGLYFFYYNFIKVHKSIKTTPAAKAGMTDIKDWTGKFFEYEEMFVEQMCNSGRVGYGNFSRKKVKDISEKDQSDFMEDILEKGWLKERTKERGPYKKTIAKVIGIAS